jgi:hypothetical protein
MDKTLPDKWVRKAVSEAIDNIVVDTFIIPCYDQRVTTGLNSIIPNYYTIMSSQTNEVDKGNKCEWNWESSILINILTSYPMPGNPGSRLLADNILDQVRNNLQNFALDPASQLEVSNVNMSFPDDLVTLNNKESVFRKFIRLELYLI